MSDTQPHIWSRRDFLMRVGALGGSAAVYRMTLALGLLPPLAQAARPDLKPVNGTRTVAILGAGIAGLVAAYELGRAGYRCVVLEGSHRAGGRNLTLRHGDRVDELGHPQVCEFDDEPHLYLNAGPARIPSNHRMLLDYCRELGVELMPFINDNRNAWIQDDAMFGGRPVRNREYVADTRGFIAELLAKGLAQQKLDSRLDEADAERLIQLLDAYGDLGPDHLYKGSRRAGILNDGMIAPAKLKGVYDFSELLRSPTAFYAINFAEAEDQSATMLQPVGGMDRIVTAFMGKVADIVELDARVESIMLRKGGVDIGYRKNGERRSLAAHYCLNSIPMQLMPGIEHNLPENYAGAFTAVPRGKLFKLGLQARDRFWEREQIYGGISWTNQDITQIWYPSHGIHKQKGVLLGAYSFGDQLGERLANMSPAERIELAIRQGEKVHPGYREHIENGVSVAWHRMNFMLGCAATWNQELLSKWFTRLQRPVGHHYMVGDQVSYHAGWQEGAIHSALHAIEDIDRRVRAEAHRGGAIA